MKNVVINGKTIAVKPVDFNGICEISENGFDFEGGKVKLFPSLRACVAYFLDIDVASAGMEIETHVKNGGEIDALVPLIEAVTESDFFQAMIAKKQAK